MMGGLHGGGAVTISAQARRTILMLAREAFPDECCGVLVGLDGNETRIASAWGVPNHAARERSRCFSIAPDELYSCVVRARAEKMDVIGFFHSHPQGSARPSPRDVRQGSGWPGYVNAIYACAHEEREGLRFYRTQPTCWRELPYKEIQP